MNELALYGAHRAEVILALGDLLLKVGFEFRIALAGDEGDVEENVAAADDGFEGFGGAVEEGLGEAFEGPVRLVETTDHMPQFDGFLLLWEWRDGTDARGLWGFLRV